MKVNSSSLSGKVKMTHKAGKMEMPILCFLPSGLQAVLLKIASVCLVPLLSQIQFPSWLRWTEIGLLHSRTVHLHSGCFYISHCGVSQFHCWYLFPGSVYTGFLWYCMEKADNKESSCTLLFYLCTETITSDVIKTGRQVILPTY